MPAVVVVSLDRSDVAERALPIAEALAIQLGARLHLISVIEIVAERGEEYYKQNEPWKTSYQETESYLSERSSAIESLPVSTEILMGLDPGYAIHSALKAMDDPLLVISTHGRSGFKRMVLGSTAARITQFASYPLIVVPARSEDHSARVSRILIALDGSAFAEHALRVTLDLFKDSVPSIHLIHILSLRESRAWQAFHDPAQSPIQGAARSYLEELTSDLEDRGIDVHWEIHQSQDVVESIVERAEQGAADLIAMATHGKTGIVRAVIGSVADGVLRASTKPVLLIRPSDEATAGTQRSEGGNG